MKEYYSIHPILSFRNLINANPNVHLNRNRGQPFLLINIRQFNINHLYSHSVSITLAGHLHFFQRLHFYVNAGAEQMKKNMHQLINNFFFFCHFHIPIVNANLSQKTVK